MAFVAPIELVVLFGMLVGCGMHTKTAIGVGLGLTLLGEFVGLKGLGIVLNCIAAMGVESRPIKEASSTPSS